MYRACLKSNSPFNNAPSAGDGGVSRTLIQSDFAQALAATEASLSLMRRLLRAKPSQ